MRIKASRITHLWDCLKCRKEYKETDKTEWIYDPGCSQTSTHEVRACLNCTDITDEYCELKPSKFAEVDITDES